MSTSHSTQGTPANAHLVADFISGYDAWAMAVKPYPSSPVYDATRATLGQRREELELWTAGIDEETIKNITRQVVAAGHTVSEGVDVLGNKLFIVTRKGAEPFAHDGLHLSS